MAITMEAVPTGHFDSGRNLTRGHKFFSGPLLESLLQEARVDLSSQDSRITVVEGLVSGMDQKASVDLATAAALPACTAAGTGVGKTLTGDVVGALSVDGVATVAGDRILVKDQVAGKDNGIYTVTQPGTGALAFILTRATDADSSSEMSANLFVWVEKGDTNADEAYVLTTNDPITVDTTSLAFTLFTLSAHALAHLRGGDLEIDGDRVDIDWNPTHSVPDATPAEAGHVDTLAAHLAGIDNQFGVLSHKQPVRLATSGALAAYTAAGSGHGKTLTANAVGAETIDGVAVVLGDRILVNDLGTATAADRGIYTVTTVGDGATAQVLTRAEDADSDADVTSGLEVNIEAGTVYGGAVFVLATANPITVDTTALSFSLRNTITHSADHIRGGILIIDGDRVVIDMTPGNYTPNAAVPEAGHADDLSAHLGGIDIALGGLGRKQAVRLATAAALNAYTAAGAGVGKTLTQNAPAVENIDGVAVVLGDRVLVNNDGTATAADRGIYTVTAVGTVAVAQVLTRALDADNDADVLSALQVRVSEGTVYGGANFVLTTANPITVDTTALSFTLVDTTTHALDHERTGLLEIDGDHVDIDYNPLISTPDATVAEAGHADALAAHLAGIDNQFGVLSHKQPVRLATAGALAAYTAAGAGHGKTLTANAVGAENIDGVAVVLGDRILVTNDGTATAADRGIYTVTTVGDGATAQVLTRAEDADENRDVIGGLTVPVSAGTLNADSEYFLTTNDPITVDTTGLSFERRGPYAGAGDIANVGGTASAGATDTVARGDHVHKLPHLCAIMARDMVDLAAGNNAAAGTVNGHATRDFDDGGAAVDEQTSCEGVMPPHYGGGNLTVRLLWSSPGAGDAKWDISVEALAAGGLTNADSFDAAQTVTTTNTGANQLVVTEFTLTNAEADGINAGELFRILVMRDSNDAADTLVGDAQLLAVTISQ